MDPFTHLTQKILAERAHQALQRADSVPATAPPPYTASEHDASDSDSDSSEEDDDDATPVKLTINAAASVEGNHNLVPTSPSPLSDATKFSALLLHAVSRINAASASKRTVRVDLTINCGVTVVGDRNVVGTVGLRPKSPAPPGPVGRMEEGAAVGGAKRKAAESPGDERGQKRRARSAEPDFRN